jgi:hypothetical protein
MGNKDELDSVRDASATVLLLKLLEMVSSGIEETSKLGTEFKETAINAATQLKAISTLSTDPASRHKLVESCNNLQKHLTKYAHPMSELIKKDIAKIIQAINIAAGEHWGLFQQTILTESIEGMKKVNLIPHSTSISDTLTTAIKSLGKNIRKAEEEK